MTAVVAPFPLFVNATGTPLTGGSVYLGTANANPETSPISAYWDAALTQPASQPLKTSGGYIVRNGTPAQVFVGSDFSMTVKTQAGAIVLYAPSSQDYQSGYALRSDIASTASGKGAALVGYLPAGSGASATRTVQANLREWVSVADFGAVGNGTTDDTAAIQNAINSLPAGGRLRLLNRHAISARLNITTPVYIEGLAQGNATSPAQTAATEFIWIGGTYSGAMVRVGLYGTGTSPLWGGGIERVSFNGGGVCAHGLEIADASYGTYKDLLVWNTTASGLHGITDGTKTGQPSAWNSFYKCFFDMRAALVASASAPGVLIEAINGTNAGITLWYFEDLKVNHSGGDGVRWNKGGDGFVFVKPQFFRADAETGYACNFASTDAADVCNHARFFYPIASGGMYFAKAGLHQGTAIYGYDSQNINTGITELVSGPGASEVGGDSSFGQMFGISRFGSTRDILIDDAMSLVRYDSANGVVFTNSGAWAVASGGAAIANGGDPGSSISLSTIASIGDSTFLSHCAASNGVSTAQWPSAEFGINISSNTAVKTRWGFFNSNADPAGDGFWIEFDPTLSSGQYRLVASRGGTQTVIVNPAGWSGTGNPIFRWRIDAQPGLVNFYGAAPGASNPQLWTFAGSITANVPITSTALACGVYVKTTAAVIKTVIVGDIKLAQRINYL